MDNKYTLKTGGGLKCSACGNDEFKEKKISKEGKDRYIYVCNACTHGMGFMEGLKKN